MKGLLSGLRQYLIKILNGMALGLFASLIIGVIITQLGELLQLDILIRLGNTAQFLMGPAIGAGVAASLGVKGLGLYSSLVTGALGAGTVEFAAEGAMLQIGEPVGALIAALIGAEVARRISGKTPVDIVLVPAFTIISGGAAGFLMAPAIIRFSYWLGATINAATALRPLPMGIVVATIMGMILTLPISSAALAISLGLEGLAAGAATVGCSSQMIGFAVISYRENGFGGLLAQGLGTSMLQIGNIVKNPVIWIPPTLAAALLGPVATVMLGLENNRIGAGMGTSGLVGQVTSLEVMGGQALPAIIFMHFILPAVLSLLIYLPLSKRGMISPGDLKLSREAD